MNGEQPHATGEQPQATEERTQLVRGLLAKGLSPQAAAIRAGVSAATAYRIRDAMEQADGQPRYTTRQALRKGLAEWLWNTNMREEDIDGLAAYLYDLHCTRP
ncbi:hypothetical protein BW14_05970 [Bifidobacterium sp. UTBIF-68]|uniref:hypothetical protein n=1 Tax=Bifidobacterium sp. UTBIF-68 TaxID=1465262 RepID=UPI00112A85E0|nr:hypothetical protein [Bifidobacterium sp. UTBIF-68]TPF93220.1 hypothetical protein BW14_05970 [Bifidobacterium sp. UTBIF-68]